MLPVGRVPSSTHRRSTSTHPFPLLPPPPPLPRSAAAAAAAGILLAACLLAATAVCTLLPGIDGPAAGDDDLRSPAASPQPEAGLLLPDAGSGDVRCPDPGSAAGGLYSLQTSVSPRGVRALTLPLEAQREVCEGLRQRVQAADAADGDADVTASPPPPPPGLLVVIPANAAHLSMAVSSLCTLAAASPAAAARAVLLALDAEALRAATARGLPAAPSPGGLAGAGVARQRDSRRVVVTLLKLRGVVLLLSWGFTVLCAEADVAYLADPLPAVLGALGGRGGAAADMAFQAEAPFLPRLSSCAGGGTTLSRAARGAAGLQCMGVFVARPTALSTLILDAADGLVVKRAVAAMFRNGGFQGVYLHEQYGLNLAVRSADNATWERIAELPRCAIAHGHDYYKVAAHAALGVRPALVHAVSVAPKERFLRAVRWMDGCAKVGGGLLAGQAAWAGQEGLWSGAFGGPGRRGTSWDAVWSLLFSRTKPVAASYARTYKKPWRRFEGKEEGRRMLGKLCHFTETNCSYAEPVPAAP